MLIKRVSEKINRPVSYADVVLLSPEDYRPGYYKVDLYAEGGSGAPRYPSTTSNWEQGCGSLGAEVHSVVFTHTKPANISAGSGGRTWDGTQGRSTVFGGVEAMGGRDGIWGPLNSNPIPFGVHVVTTYNTKGEPIGDFSFSAGGRGWTISQSNSSGFSGTMTVTLGAGVL